MTCTTDMLDMGLTIWDDVMKAASFLLKSLG